MTVKPTYEELERRVQELEKIESELEYSKEILQVYEKASLGYQSLDENGHYITVNQNWLDTLGYAKEEVIGKSFADFIHADCRHHFKENFPRFKSIDEILGAEFEVVKKNGALIKVSLTGKISRDKNGGFQQTHCIFHDITERKRAEFERKSTVRMLEILNAQTVLRQLMHSLLQFMQEITGCEAVGIRLCNGNDFPYYEVSGFSDDFVKSETYLCVEDLNGQLELDDIGNPVLECMCGNVIRGRSDSSKPFFTEFGSFVTNSTTRLLAGTSEQDRQARTRNRCNGEGYESVLLIPLRTGGKTFGLLQFNDRQEGCFPQQIVNHMEKIAGNVSLALAQRELEKALKESEKRYRTILNEMAEGYHEVDLAGNFTFFNEAFHNLFGYSRDEMLGTNFSHYAAEESIVKKVYQTYNEIYKTGNPVRRTEWDIIRKDGQRRTLEYSAAVVRDSENAPKGFRGIARDITEHKQIEQKQEKLQAQLHQAQKLESIGSLAGGIAHDFNNLLFPIVGLAEMMLEDFPPGSPEHYDVQQIFKAGKRGRELVQQILSFSRQSDYQLIPVHIQKILKEVLKLCRATIPADITIKQDLQTDCNLVMADPTQIHQIAMNLITNAFHAVEPTGGTIKVALKEIDLCHEDDPDVQLASGRYAVLSVIDTGTGIDPAVMNKIFDPYFTTKEKGRGTGLGLATVYGIVKAHRGDIRVHSEMGKGSFFHVYLPVLEKSAADVFEKQQQPLPTGTEHIMVVDDEAPIAHMEKKMLERLGYRITSFTSSVDALAEFKKDPSFFDLIITDMNMPNTNGMQLAQELIAVRPDIPVIICTGFSERINSKKTDVMGIRGLLMKPLRMKDLAQKVREVLDTMKE